MKTDFIKFSDISVEQPESWKGKRILSFDIDWASDEVLNYVIDIVEEAQVKCCFFVTHNTPVLERIRKDKKFELGIHPNFNPLIQNNSTKSADEILTDLKAIVPEATVFRSHSLTTSGSFLGLYKKHGANYLSNYMMNGVKNIQPFYQVNGQIEVPIYYADDGELFLTSNPDIPRKKTPFDKPNDGIQVYNFHPIHVALNCTNIDDYQQSKNEALDVQRINYYSENRVGIKNKLLELIN